MSRYFAHPPEPYGEGAGFHDMGGAGRDGAAGNRPACASQPEAEKGEHIVIIGAGAIGMLAGMAALAYGGIYR